MEPVTRRGIKTFKVIKVTKKKKILGKVRGCLTLLFSPSVCNALRRLQKVGSSIMKILSTNGCSVSF